MLVKQLNLVYYYIYLNSQVIIILGDIYDIKYNNDPRRYAKFHINTYGLIKIDGIYFFGTINNIDEKIRKRHIVYRMNRIKIK